MAEKINETMIQPSTVTQTTRPGKERVFVTIWRMQGYGLVLLTFLSFSPRLFHVEEYLFFALLLVALVTAWLEGKSIRIRTPIDLPLLLFVGWVLFTVPFATDPAYSFAEWRKLAAQVLLLYWACFTFRAQARENITQRVLAAVVIGSAVMCTYVLVDFVEQGGTWKDRGVRAGFPVLDGVRDFAWVGTNAVIAIPIVASLVLAVRARWQRVACASVFALEVLALVFSYVRGAWLGVVAEGIAFGLFTGRRWIVLWVLGCGIAIGVGLVAVSQIGYQRDTVDPWTLNARTAVWKRSFGEVVEHPLVGVGYGTRTFKKKFGPATEPRKTDLLHNWFVMVTMGSGIPALVLLGWVLGSAVRSLTRLTGKVDDRQTYALVVGTAVMIVGFVVCNFFNDAFGGSHSYLFWILVANGLFAPMKSDGPGGSAVGTNSVPP